MSVHNEENASTLSPEQFNAVLMSFIHDIKNSLLMALGSLEALYYQLDELNPEHKNQLTLIQYELRRINNSLLQLLSLYKMENQLFSVQADQYNLYDFLDELIISNKPLDAKENFSIELECDEDTEWFFDKDLIGTIINSTINNSIRYANSKVILSAKISNDYLNIIIEDDGQGFPQKMFDRPDTLETAINMKTGSTGLGLYFAEQIAKTHINGDLQGVTTIDNQSRLGGGRFSLLLP